MEKTIRYNILRPCGWWCLLMWWLGMTQNCSTPFITNRGRSCRPKMTIAFLQAHRLPTFTMNMNNSRYTGIPIYKCIYIYIPHTDPSWEGIHGNLRVPLPQEIRPGIILIFRDYFFRVHGGKEPINMAFGGRVPLDSHYIFPASNFAPKGGGPNRLEGSIATNTSGLSDFRHLGFPEMSQCNFLGP